MSTSPSIHVLADAVANQIAAGEVIERPAAVVKELIENSLDAGATRIEIEFRQAGREYIRIEDNGSGMIREDALLALQRHATSKISLTKDLDKLSTFGFRGEAIPSIASISHFTLETKSELSSEGTHISVDAGKLLQVRACGRAPGTTLEIAHLFHPVPARRKFLKTDATEAAHIIQTVRLYALARPDVAFSLKEDAKLVFRSAVCLSLKQRAGELLGYSSVSSMLNLSYVDEAMKLEGLVGLPSESKSSRHDMLTFVNGRPVDSRTINFALIEAYSPFLVKGKYPQVILFFQCDPAHVDVNVHPAKREVKFKNDSQVRSFVIRAVLGLLKSWADKKTPITNLTGNKPQVGLGEFRNPFSASFAPSAVVREVQASYQPKITAETKSEFKHQLTHELSVPNQTAWRFIGSAQLGYFLFDTSAGIVVLDYKAAEERIWYERILNEGSKDGVPSQTLLLPLSLEFDPISSALLLDHSAVFQSYGFQIAEFGRHFYRLEAIPAWLEVNDAEQFLRELIAALREESFPASNKNAIQEHFALLAAVRRVNRSTSNPEQNAQTVVDELFTTLSPLITPRGKPTFFEIDRAELNRRFNIQ